MDAKSLIYFHLLFGLCKYYTCSDLGDSDTIFIPDYDMVKYPTERTDLRKNFMKRRNQEKKMEMINRGTNTVYIDGITHYESDHFSLKDKAEQFDSEFIELLSMKEFKYMYQRDTNWRTWRDIAEPNGNKTMISYRCQNNSNSTVCGFWVIEEESPPCPFELFSVKDDTTLCGARLSQLNQELGECPSVIRFGELTAKCDNPIYTRWRFTRLYNRDTKKARDGSHLICGWKDYCELTTLYDITPQHVVFRLINASSEIIYSRVMKPGRRNFICVESCGKIDFNNMKVTPSDTPTSLDLLQAKNKREDKKILYYKPKAKPRRPNQPSKIKRIVMFQANKVVHHNVSLPLRRTSTPMPMLPWLKIRRAFLDYYDNLDIDEKGDFNDDVQSTTTHIL